ncbi:4-hydroxythreonine-4-phosphate dehydrogenase PdxA [uncultured Anaerococcus sp.]|uniref:4-hydroxythreonine-4-phosphate dehydrogenase PdxA n=1 Tax=uncultured Anaerococcus sp. TaxID=293428 RepID=UPI002627B01B|nr:4-hydroxythreonine-4-phosphate dehydrogenase PdxA [uncultured Anaerococcus sp.]
MTKIAITMGDPSGIGPEISLKVLNKSVDYKNKCIIYGSKEIIEKYKNILNIDEEINYINSVDEFKYDNINVVNIGSNKDIKIGKVDPYSGKLAFKYIETAINDAISNKVSAVVTCPINKEALNKGGINYQGHTEIFADLTNTKSYTMMLWSEKLVVDHVSTHVSLKEACDLVKTDRVLECIKLLDEALKKLNGRDAKIAVAGLNPHAGENSMFGDQEEKEIIPAIKKAQEIGIKAEGPIPPDTVFFKASNKIYDGVICMYHDQGHIPLKLLDFYNGVNVTLGLPIIRTSVDHGTAFDIAGQGIANEGSLIGAIELAEKLI